METPKKRSVIQPSDKYMVRFPDGVRDRIAEAAKANNRSMNAEIVARIERSFATENMGLKGDPLDVLGYMSSVLLLSLGDKADNEEMQVIKENAKEMATHLAKNFYLAKTGKNMVDVETTPTEPGQ